MGTPCAPTAPGLDGDGEAAGACLCGTVAPGVAAGGAAATAGNSPTCDANTIAPEAAAATAHQAAASDRPRTAAIHLSARD